jgi:tetratricopeptide (TPR) repeat protein
MVAVYDLVLRQEVARFAAHPDIVGALAFSADAGLLASGSRGEIKVWRKKTTSLTALPSAGAGAGGEASTVSAGTTGGGAEPVLVASADGAWKAELTPGKPIRIVKAAGGSEVAKLSADRGLLNTLAEVELGLAGVRFEVAFLEAEIKTVEERIAKVSADLEKSEKELAAVEPKRAEHEKALADAIESARLEPRYMKAHYRQGLALLRLGRGAEAVAARAERVRAALRAEAAALESLCGGGGGGGPS